MNDSDYFIKLAIENGDTELANLINGDQPLNTVKRDHSDIIVELLLLRHMAKLSQKELAQKLAMPQSGLARIEAGKGNPTLKTLQRLARELGAELHLRRKP